MNAASSSDQTPVKGRKPKGIKSLSKKLKSKRSKRVTLKKLPSSSKPGGSASTKPLPKKSAIRKRARAQMKKSVRFNNNQTVHFSKANAVKNVVDNEAVVDDPLLLDADTGFNGAGIDAGAGAGAGAEVLADGVGLDRYCLMLCEHCCAIFTALLPGVRFRMFAQQLISTLLVICSLWAYGPVLSWGAG
ncbi:uncharacterized protein BJ171DRAFT_482939 [Polychytrium aggregatum]|uniref:uncharacterized protein n=1 Tax=Polychytrium aggregatum TaxID=110093 RepID=UPI0022FEA087|nr:uncharacterized protein BJ171DRAFT_575624 [Polychytrium aggregatum]XP_052961516.1 uncharacterized protein BJ171DRAFT_482939 [Polychytrium aggregatum]KAI9188586.1 hypothetical protein BJ171DRAFT_575624 [Polychytrium aggregatum]KAI9190534.1 hypothetical protein BJ171DRAFT_482939 [Polychytrium aggregatum]